MDVNFHGTDYTGMTIHPLTISLNEGRIQHPETYTQIP